MKLAKTILLLLILVIFGGGLFIGLTRSDFVKLHDIVITGASPQTEARIRPHLISKIGESIWKFPVEKIAENIRRDPWVESVEIRRQIPQTLLINIHERKPVAVLGNGQGSFKYLDELNTVIESKPDVRDLSRYPTFFGMYTPDKIKLREQALALLKTLPAEGFISRKDISDVSYDDEHGYQMTLSKTGILVELGKEDLPLRIDRARKVVQYLDQHHINATRIDSDYAKKVLVKVRKGR